MAKKQTSEFTVPPETITKGGSYIVDPVKGKAERVSFMVHEPAALSAEPQPREFKVAKDAQADSVTQPTE